MVDSIGPKTGASVDPRAGPAPVAPVQTVKATTDEPSEVAAPTTATDLARNLASQAPIDVDRVAQIRKAIRDGKFPLVTSTVADRLLALKLQWNGENDAT